MKHWEFTWESSCYGYRLNTAPFVFFFNRHGKSGESWRKEEEGRTKDVNNLFDTYVGNGFEIFVWMDGNRQAEGLSTPQGRMGLWPCGFPRALVGCARVHACMLLIFVCWLEEAPVVRSMDGPVSV